MIQLIQDNLRQTEALCEAHKVDYFALFGSATRSDFHQSSDLDFLVRFSSNLQLLDFADNYFDLVENLENLLKRPIDLVTEKSLKNPVLIKEINRSKVLLYES